MNISLLTLQLVLGDTTQHPHPHFIKPNASQFDYKKYEIAVSKKYSDSILDALDPEFPWLLEGNNKKLTDYKNWFHFVDLNNDKLPDVIYEGRSPGEPTMVQIFMHRQWRMENVLQDFMTIRDLVIENKRLQSLVIINYGCCAEYVQFERHFRPDKQFNFILIRQRAILEGMDVRDDDFPKPDVYFEKPVRFKTVNREYALRYSPAISEKVPEVLGLTGSKGNIIALYPQGAEGNAWGYKKDATGREWWLVEMDPQSELSYNEYWNYEEKPTYYYGWMSSRYLERLQ